VVDGERVVGVVSSSDVLDFTSATAIESAAAPEDESDGDYWNDPEDWVPLPEDEDPSSFFREFWPDTDESVVERLSHSETEARDILEGHSVAEIMTRSLCFLSPDSSVREAAAFMLSRGIHRILVMDGDRLEGIVSTSDIVRAVADGRL
jgi:CBS domain-containing protein